MHTAFLISASQEPPKAEIPPFLSAAEDPAPGSLHTAPCLGGGWCHWSNFWLLTESDSERIHRLHYIPDLT